MENRKEFILSLNTNYDSWEDCKNRERFPGKC